MCGRHGFDATDRDRARRRASTRARRHARGDATVTTTRASRPTTTRDDAKARRGEAERGMPTRILCVAEKPSLASAIARTLARGGDGGDRGVVARRGLATEVHEFATAREGSWAFASGTRDGRAEWRVTSTTGHVASVEFSARYQAWEGCEPGELFAADVVKRADGRMVGHLEREARGCDYLVLFLDCDREGENICFEVMEACAGGLKTGATEPGAPSARILRAKFSAVTRESIERAMRTLGEPNRNEALAVDARQELDLKMGVAFTRFQTQYFLNKYDRLDARVVSYGPCQTPTLGFAVQRHLEIIRHVPEPYWALDASFDDAATGDTIAPAWRRTRLFDEETTRAFLQLVNDANEFRVTSIEVNAEKRGRPSGLNTVEMLKAASAGLGMGAHRAMQVAERLYMAGHISYPRTESTAYPRGFELKQTLTIQKSHPTWGAFVSRLLDESSMTSPKRGVDAGDHPPITPMRASTEDQVGGGEAWRLYDFISRHFIASVSPDCEYETQTATLDAGGEEFTLQGKRVIEHGWTEIMPHRMIEDSSLPVCVVQGARIPLKSVRLRSESTSPPEYLTESELIGLMEKNGIGTDASIPTHINNIQVRKYVDVAKGRRIVPSQLGITLVQGYHAIDSELVLPTVRRHVERQLDLVAKGQAPYEGVVAHILAQMFDKFNYFTTNIAAMDALFEASFSHTTTESTPYSKCGRCSRYLKLVGATGRIQRLYCPTEEVVYELPIGGVFKQHNGRTCAICGFELLIVSQKGTGRAYPLCPFCFNHPPFEGAPRIKALLRGSPHPREHPVADDVSVSTCPECAASNRPGVLMLDPAATSPGKLYCSSAACDVLVRLPPSVKRSAVSHDAECAACEAKCLDLEMFNGDKATVCLRCEDELSESVRVVRVKPPSSGRGGRGRGGRGGRGRDDERRRE